MKVTILILSILFATVTSCNSNDNDNETYYKIEGTDFEYIPTSYESIDNIITFKNQNDDIVRFKTNKYRIEKTHTSTGMTAGISSYYDKLWISLLLLDMEFTGDDDHRCRDIQIEISKFSNGLLHNRIHLPAAGSTGNSCTGNIKIFNTPDPTNNIEEMIINNITYNKVLILEVSGGMIDYYSFFNNSTIHKVYYDLKYGISVKVLTNQRLLIRWDGNCL